MTLVVRDEAEMIEANLDYHLAQGVDFVLVTDHGSTDGTRELLRPYERAGVASVIEDDAPGHHQSRRVTRMARLAVEHGADWLIHNDADEFYWPLAGRLSDLFASIPEPYAQIVVPRRNFLPLAATGGPPAPGPVPSSAGAGRVPFYARMEYREAESRNLIGAPLEPKVAHRAHPHAVLAPGNHTLRGVAFEPVPDLGLLEIFHFPMRSYPQFEKKVIQTGEGYIQITDRAPDLGRDQLELYARHQAGELRRYWDEVVGGDAGLARGLADGSIVHDRRLAAFMERCAAAPAPVEAPDGASMRGLVAGALGAFAERDGNRAWLQTAQAELEAARAHVAAQDETLADLRAELERTAATLDALLGSRLMRFTAARRRRWYRARGLG